MALSPTVKEENERKRKKEKREQKEKWTEASWISPRVGSWLINSLGLFFVLLVLVVDSDDCEEHGFTFTFKYEVSE